jgi:hypothetical protein
MIANADLFANAVSSLMSKGNAGAPLQSADRTNRSTEQSEKFWASGKHSSWILVLLPLTLWIWLCRDWPVRLGFYSDDWIVLLHPFVGTAEAFRGILNAVATRPVSAPFIWLAQLIVDWSPVRSQLLNAAMLLVTAASVGMLAAALSLVVRPLRAGALAAACVASATFIVFPSSVGTFAWGTGVTTTVPAVPLFCLATSLLLHSEGKRWRLVLALAIALLSHLSYEAFYFQEVTFILLAAVLRGSKPRNIHWQAIAGAALVNIGCIAFNRLTSGGVQKSFHWEFFHLFVWAYRHIPETFGHATREHQVLITTSVLVAGLSGAICLAHLVGAAMVRIALLVTTCGIVASSFLYAFAGYPLAMEGPMARVSIVIATYYAITSGVLAAAAWRAPDRRRWPVITFWLFAATGLMALGLTARSRLGEWADTWSYEVARLSRLPDSITSSEFPRDGVQRVYVAIEKRTPSAVDPATAPSEINGAIAWASYQITNSRLLTIDLWRGSRTAPRWFATPPNWFNRWDGKSFTQGRCGEDAIYSAQGSELWSWDTSTGETSKIDAPWEHGCQIANVGNLK